MPSADALITPPLLACSPLIFALGSLYLYSEFRCLCRGKWPQAWSSLSQLNAVGFNSWKTQLSSVLEVLWELSKFALLAREIWRLSLCCVSMVMLIPAGRKIICSQVEKCFFPPVFPLHLNPGLVVSGFILTLPVSRGVWEGPDPVAFLQVRVFMKQREAGVRGCGCLRSEEADLEIVCQPSVLPPWLSPSAQSWGEPCEPPICWNLGL